VKIVYLIIASNNLEHKRDEEAQSQTWANQENLDVIWLRGGNETYFDAENRTLTVRIAEKYENILKKTLLGINWCLDNLEFDFLIRGNVSTYFRVTEIEKHMCKRKSKEIFVGGFLDFAKRENESLISCVFVNGGAIFLNRRACTELINMSIANWQGLPDDFAITQYLISIGCKPARLARGNVSNTGILTNKPFYRLKSSRNSSMASIRMQNLHSLLNAKGIFRKGKVYLVFQITELRFFKQNFLNIGEYVLSTYSVLSSYLKWNVLKFQGKI
jgi:hypothetical protein